MLHQQKKKSCLVRALLVGGWMVLGTTYGAVKTFQKGMRLMMMVSSPVETDKHSIIFFSLSNSYYVLHNTFPPGLTMQFFWYVPLRAH